MQDERKIVMELIVSLFVLGVSILAYMYVGKHLRYSQTEAEEEAHLKRLFGDAWREARDL